LANAGGKQADRALVFEVGACILNKSGYGIAMWTGEWMTKRFHHSFLHGAGNVMLQASGLFMYLMPLHTEHVDKKALG
jgi:hypothetical protein